MLSESLKARPEYKLPQWARAMCFAIANYHPATFRHSVRVAEITAGMTDGLLTDDNKLITAAVLHDVGKIGIPLNIIDKNGPLNTAEGTLMRMHALAGFKMVQPFDSEVAKILVAAHEFQDGGYPRSSYRSAKTDPRLRELQVMLAIADKADALMSPDRTYRNPSTPMDALVVIQRSFPAQSDLVRRAVMISAGLQFRR